MVTLDYTPFQNSFRVFVKLTGLKQQSIENKWIRDEFDVADALTRLPAIVKHTARMMGKRMHAKSDYDFVDDVRKDIQEHLLVGEDDRRTALNKKKHLNMYYLTVEPAIHLLQQCDSHSSAIEEVDNIVEQLTNIVMNHTIHTTYDDALVAQKQVQLIIESRKDVVKIPKKFLSV